jgi:hypothetical protein
MVRIVVLVTLLAPVSGAQQPGAPPAGRGSVSGIVFDSVAGAPLAHATVQLVPNENATRPRTVTSDSSGRYAIDVLADGHYLVGFFHAMLDSLGLEPPVREVFVRDGAEQRVDLSIPSPTRIRATICGAASPNDSGAIVIGFTRNAADGSPAPHVRITGEWNEISFTSSGMTRSTPRLVSVSLENGWFAMCGVPRGGTMVLTASRGEDSSGVVELQIPASGFARRDLYIASTPPVAGDSTAMSPTRREVRRGHVRLHGTVRRAASGEAVAAAQVALVEGPHTTTNGLGEWTLVDAPPGTRMLEVRAVGMYPERIAVNVIAGAPPIHIAMNTLRAVLDTITVRAGRLADLRSVGGRRRAGAGRFIEARALEQHPGKQLSEILLRQAGIHELRGADGGSRLALRGTEDCPAELYVDGQYLFDVTTVDLDHWVQPQRVRGVELYLPTTTPPQFQQPLNACGSIVIWTK